MTKRKSFSFLIPFACVAASSLFLFTSIESKFSDLFQRILPATQLRDDVVMVGIDDFAIEQIGSFPFTRDVYADCISVMEEMGAESIVFALSFIDSAKAGFVNASPDSDNFYRRVNLFAKYDGKYYPQLTIPALLKKLGNPKIIVEGKKITLGGAKLPNGSEKDIVIPRGNDGKFILKYPPVQFNDYNYLSIGDIYRVSLLRLYMAEDGEEAYIEEYTKLCHALKKQLNSALCIVGTCATSTSDYGVNQYEAQYPLPGVHYTFANQLLNGDFVGESPVWVSILYALVFAILIVIATGKIKSTGGKIIFGLLLICLSSTILLVYYKFTRIYLGETVPLISSILAYISSIVLGFLSASKDKKFITNAFSQCLAFKIMVENGKEIFTRIGINSGEMIAGYMGSENKKNYTMMGNNVNLASRLEGVNKQYSTFGILVSEATYKELGDEILCRRLDRVQVVNVNTPLMLYEPLCLKENASEQLQKYAEVWESAMKDFEHEDYKNACDKFKKLSEANPADKVAAYYVKLLEKFFLKGTFPKEEDDFGVAYNSALKCFRLLSK